MNLKELRESRSLTQAQLSALSGVHIVAISKLETGTRSPNTMTLETAAKLAKALGVHAEDLINE